MSRIHPLLKTISKPIGQNLDNEPEDIYNLKRKMKSLGYYNQSTSGPLIDGSLVKGIKKYQSDYGLKTDGVIMPGGLTEAKILGSILNKENKIRPYEQVSWAQTLPWVIRTTKSAKKAYDSYRAWQKLNPSERQEEIDKLCDSQLDKDLSICKKLPAKNGRSKKEVFSICHGTAMNRYSKCLSGDHENIGPLYNGE